MGVLMSDENEMPKRTSAEIWQSYLSKQIAQSQAVVEDLINYSYRHHDAERVTERLQAETRRLRSLKRQQAIYAVTPIQPLVMSFDDTDKPKSVKKILYLSRYCEICARTINPENGECDFRHDLHQSVNKYATVDSSPGYIVGFAAIALGLFLAAWALKILSGF